MISKLNKNDNDSCMIGFAKKEISKSLTVVKPLVTPLEANAFYINSKDCNAVWLCLDLMDIDKTSIDSMKNHLAEKTDLEDDNIHILSTHNHGGGEIEDYDIARLASVLLECAESAMQNAQEAYVTYGETLIEEQLNYIRRFYSKELAGKTTVFWGPSSQNNYASSAYLAANIMGIKNGTASFSGTLETDRPEYSLPPGDTRLQLMFFEKEDGTPLGSICRFAAHAVCCNSPEHYSSDYPYHVRAAIENELGGTAVFLNGPCAEIAPGILGKDPEAAEFIGKNLGMEAVKSLKGAERKKIEFVKDSSVKVALPLREEMLDYDSEAEKIRLEERLEHKDELTLPELKEIAERRLFLHSCLPFLKSKATCGGNSQPITLGKLVINDIKIIAGPGEIFNSTFEDAVKRKNGDKILTVTEHDGTVMYIVPEKEYDSGGYEIACCMVSKDAENILKKEINKLIND